MPPAWHELYRSVVLPAHCDHYGHMNVRQYAAFFDDAGWQILGKLGVSLTDLRARGLGSVVASLTIDFHHELRAGQLIVVSGAVTRVGDKSLSYDMRLHEADTMMHCATQKTVKCASIPRAAPRPDGRTMCGRDLPRRWDHHDQPADSPRLTARSRGDG